MRKIYYAIFILLLLNACSSQDTYWRLQKTIIASDTPGVDSLLQIEWGRNGQESSSLLFYIACGGDLEYLTDTIIHKDSEESFAIISIGDYFQEQQLFYIVYDIQNNQLKQSKRIYLPNWELSDFSEVQIANVSSDSLFLKTSMGMIKPEKLEPLVYNQHKIINYYEFE